MTFKVAFNIDFYQNENYSQKIKGWLTKSIKYKIIFLFYITMLNILFVFKVIKYFVPIATNNVMKANDNYVCKVLNFLYVRK